MRMKKSVLRFVCAFVVALVVGLIVLGVTAVIYVPATDCPDTAGVCEKCSR